MKFFKKYFWFFLIVFLVPNFYSIGVYQNNGDFIYYTNTNTPKINISLFSPLENMFVQQASLRVNQQNYVYDIGEDVLIGGEVDYSFSLEDFGFSTILESDEVFFKLEAFGRNSRPIKPNGDETSFFIKVDKIVPILFSPSQKNVLQFSGQNQKLELLFSEPIFSYKIYLNGNLVESYQQQRRLKSSFLNQFEIDLDLSSINDGLNELYLEFYDLSENKGNATINFAFKGEDLAIKMLTSKDDSNLKYFFDKTYLDFFENNIYTSEDSFMFKLQTNKPSKCYYTYNRDSFGYFKDFSDSIKIQLNSDSDKLNHEFQVDLGGGPYKRFWLACQNDIYPEEVVYLNDELSLPESLLFFKRYLGIPLKVDSIHPGNQVSYNPIDIIVNTNEQAVCLYSLGNVINKRLNSQEEFKYHRDVGINLNSKNNNLNILCIDKLGREVRQSRNFILDLENGVRVFPQNLPMYSSAPSYLMSVTLSEQADCRASLKILGDVGEFNSLPTSNSSDFNREFLVSSLIKGENDVYIYCKKDGSIFDNKFEIIYDPDGPKLSNLSFFNNDVSSNYISSISSFEFGVEVEALIPVEKFFLELIGTNNNNTYFIFPSQRGKVNYNLTNFTKIKLIAENKIGQNSSALEKNIQFDLEGPTVDIIYRGNQAIITCFDEKSGCEKIFYGFSLVEDLCTPTNIYLNQSLLDVIGKNFICVKAIDKVGHETIEFKSVSLGFSFSDLDDFNNSGSLNDSSTLFPEVFENETEDVDTFLPDLNNRLPPTQSSNDGLIIISAIILLLAGVSGGGYYAYRKGYLDNQLLKYGLLKKKENSLSKENPNFSNNQPNIFGNKKNIKNTKSNYDNHLRKLNDFIDHTLDNRKDVFDNFAIYDNKGKVEGFMDTLAKKPKKAGETISKEDLDEFYESSGRLNSKNSLSLEEEAEKFEEFYRKKSQAEKQNGDSKKQNNKKK